MVLQFLAAKHRLSAYARNSKNKKDKVNKTAITSARTLYRFEMLTELQNANIKL